MEGGGLLGTVQHGLEPVIPLIGTSLEFIAEIVCSLHIYDAMCDNYDCHGARRIHLMLKHDRRMYII